jgi:hypothetical protein
MNPQTAKQIATVSNRKRRDSFAYPFLARVLASRNESLLEADPGTPTYDATLGEFIKKRAPKGASR